MITEDKITEIFCMADDFCKLFDAMHLRHLFPNVVSYNRIGINGKSQKVLR